MGWYYGYDDDYDDGEFDAEDEGHETPPGALSIQGPLHAESKRGDIGREWWGRQWVQAMEHLGLSSRMERGKRYARNGSVKLMEIGHGEVYALVGGSRGRSYHTRFLLRRIDDEQWQQALDALSEQAIFAAKLLAGEMPADIEAVFQSVGLSLFPQKKRDIDFDCSCPDWGDPCKHAAAVYYLLAEQFDRDPFVLFHLRGRSREQVLSALRGAMPTDTDTDADENTDAPPQVPALDADLTAFWQGEGEPLVNTMPDAQHTQFALRQLGGVPQGIPEHDLRQLYDRVGFEARRWLGLDTDTTER